MKFLGLRYQTSEFFSTIKAKRGMKTFNKEVCHAQCKVHFCYTLMPKIKLMARLFKFHATSLARNQSPTPNNAIKYQSNRLSHWSAQIIPVFFVLCSMGKFRLSGSCKMPIIDQSTSCKVFNMGDVISPSHLW